MDGDPSQEDRIRLIGRLFFIFTIYFQQAISYVRVQVVSRLNISALCGAFDANVR